MLVKLNTTQKIKVENTMEVANIMQEILNYEDIMGQRLEHLWVIGLNNAYKILYVDLVALGYTNCIDANPTEIFRMAIHKLAVKVMLVHNCPAGKDFTSHSYLNMTDRMVKAGELVGIDVVDHIVLHNNDFFSFAGNGMMNKLKESNTWRLMLQLEGTEAGY